MPLRQEIPYLYTEFLLLCSEEHTLVYIQKEIMLVHTLKSVSCV